MRTLPTLILCAAPVAADHLCAEWTSHNVEESMTFLPAKFTESPSTREASLQLRERLRDLGGSCHMPFYPVGPSHNAWGSHVNSLVFPLAYGYSRNRTAMSPSLGAYANGSCATFSCFFRPLSSCDSRPSRRRLSSSPQRCNQRKRLFSCYDGKGCESQSCDKPDLFAVALKKGEFSYGTNGLASIPAEYRHLGHFWYVAHLLSWLLRPNQRTLEAIRRRARDIGMNAIRRPMIVVHARAGDSCRQEARKRRRCSHFEEYWYHVLAMKHMYSARSVFFATDDDDLASMARNASSPDFPVYVSGAPARNWDIVLGDESSGAVLDRTQSALDIIVDIALLARGDAFVGKFTSNVDRIAYALLSAHSDCLKPYVSMDSMWCHDWSNAVGRSIHGQFLC